MADLQGDPDVIKINLATGHITQLTHNFTWDEDGAISPDGQLYTLESARTRPGAQALGWIPQLETYPIRGMITAGDQLAEQQMWSPDSTEVLMQESTRQRPPKGSNSQIARIDLSPHRIVIARIAWRPTRPLQMISSNVGPWAPSPNDYHATIGSGATVTLRGTAVLSLSDSIPGGRWSVDYNHYSQDGGKTFLNSSDTTTGSPDGLFTLDASLLVPGANSGDLSAALSCDHAGTQHTTSSYYRATYDGRVAPPIANLGLSCYRYLPHATRLRVKTRIAHGRLTATVSADIHGETRLVSGAIVRLGGARAVTGKRGQGELPAPSHRERLSATAGHTFIPESRMTTP